MRKAKRNNANQPDLFRVPASQKAQRKSSRRPVEFEKRATWQTRILFLALAGVAIPAAADTNWQGGTGTWVTGTNWDNGVPTSSVTARINTSGTAIINSGVAGSASTLFVGNTNGSTLLINGGASLASGNALLGDSSGFFGAAAVSGTWNSSQVVYVGSDGTGTLTINSGGLVSGANGSIGYHAGSHGTATVSGTWSNSSFLDVGQLGTGTLTINSGGLVSDQLGYLGYAPGSSGTATVSGTWVSSTDLHVGHAGSGTLTIAGNGLVSSGRGVIGDSPNSTGSVVVSGTWNDSGDLSIGASGSGALTINSGGVVASSNGYIANSIGSSGTATVSGIWTNSGVLDVGYATTGALVINSGGLVSNSDATIAVAAGSTGSATVSGTWNNAGNLTLGYLGAGTLTINSGGLVLNKTGALGSFQSSTGSATVSGTWSNSSDLFIGFFNNSSGTLTINSGGLVLDQSAHLGYSASTSGIAVVSGTWTSSGDLHVGENGSGTLTINSGGYVSSYNGSIANSPSSTGVATVSGTWNVGNDFQVGSSGTGMLTINSGGVVMDRTGFVGVSGTASSGSATVSGTWVHSGDLLVGVFGGTGSLTVNSSGVVSDQSGYLGYGNSSMGTAVVSGTWTSSGDLHVGESGTGTLTINSGGYVSSYNGTIADLPFSTGVATVSGTWNVGNDFQVGSSGTGMLTINSGGVVMDRTGFVGVFGTALSSSATVSGTWVHSGDLLVGVFGGTGSLTVNSSGVVSSQSGYLGYGNSSMGTAVVSGTWYNSNALTVGSSGTGALTLGSGGFLSASNGVVLAANAGSQGTLQIGDGSASPGIVSAPSVSGGQGSAKLVFNLANGGYLFSPNITGSIALTNTGSGTTILTGTNSYTGTTTITSGTLQIGNGGTTGALGTGATTNNSALVFDRSGTLTASSAISGTGSLTQIGDGTTILTGSNTYSGATTISSGTLQIGNGSVIGTLGSADVLDNGALIFDRANTVAISNAISGTGSLAQKGEGSLILTGSHSYTGATTVSAGQLIVNGSLGKTAVTVNAGGTLGGMGKIAGVVTIQSGGTLSAGNNSVDTLTLGELSLNSGAKATFDLGAPNVVGGGVNDLVDVVANLDGSGSTGNLTIGGIFNLNTKANFGTGTYRLFNYTGTRLGNHGVLFGLAPAGYNLAIDATRPGQVNLQVNYDGLQFWNGSHTAPDGTVHGGDGDWNSTSTNWTDDSGNTANASTGQLTAVFSRTAGTVNVVSNINVAGLQFGTDGYVLKDGGGSLVFSASSSEIRVNDGVSAVIGAVLTGTGGIVKTGGGIVTLSGSNTYSGGTTINSEVLSISSDQNLGEASGKLTFNGGTLQTSASFTSNRDTVLNATGTFDVAAGTILTWNGSLTGSGGLTKTSEGLLVLGGPLNYGGTTTDIDGVLEFHTDTSGLTGPIIDNALVKFSSNTSSLYSGAISGTGALWKTGTATLVLSGSNTYSGGTRLGGGAVQVAKDQNLGDSNGGLFFSGGALQTTASFASSRNAVLNGVGQFDTASRTTLTWNGAVTGAADLVKEGSGRLILTASNSYLGGTAINSGILQISADDNLGSASTPLALSGGGTLQFGKSFNLASKRQIVLGDGGGVIDTQQFETKISQSISGTGGLTKAGTGTLDLTGSSNYSGGTLVESGTLLVNGTLSKSSVTVDDQGVLGGDGFIAGNVQNFGILSPGNSLGTLHIGGNLTLQNSSVFLVQLASPTVYDRVIVGKTARLNGTLQVLTLGNFVPTVGEQFQILTAPVVTGSFDSFIQPASVQLSIVYNPASVVLEVGQQIPYPHFALTSNQLSAANALQKLRGEQLGKGTDFDAKIRPVLDLLSAASLRAAFNAVDPVESIAFSQTALDESRMWLPQMATRLADIRAGSTGFVSNGQPLVNPKAMKGVLAPAPENPWGVWVDGSGDFADADSNSGSVAVGVDYRITKDFTLGLYSGYLGTQNDFGSGNEIDSNGSRFGLYSTYKRGGFYLDGVVGGQWNTYDWQRMISFPGIDRSTTAETEGTVFETMFGGGYDWNVAKNCSFGLFDTLEYTSVSTSGFTESGAGSLNLRLADQNAESLRTNLGVQLASVVRVGSFRLHPSASVAWRHEYLDSSYAVSSAFEGGAGPSFSTSLYGPNRRDSLLINAGVSLDLTRSVSVYTYYTGDLGGGGADIHSVNGGIRWEF